MNREAPISLDRSLQGDQAAWRLLSPGAQLDVVKLSPEGNEAARYAGTVVACRDPEHWVIVHATWTYHEVAMDGLVFSPGDFLLEWFSPDCMFNAFAVYTPLGDLRGWYANVTHPAYLATGSTCPTLVWHDLYLDLVGLPNGAFVVRDEDELAESGLASSNPKLWQRINAAGDEVVSRFQAGAAPFIRLRDVETKLVAGKELVDTDGLK